MKLFSATVHWFDNVHFDEAEDVLFILAPDYNGAEQQALEWLKAREAVEVVGAPEEVVSSLEPPTAYQIESISLMADNDAADGTLILPKGVGRSHLSTVK